MRHLIIFARRPELGRVKTRLARDIGVVAAYRFYENTLLRLTRSLSLDKRWKTWLAITPNHTKWANPFVLKKISQIPQGQGNLGERMFRCISRFENSPAIIIGSDIPAIKTKHISNAFKALQRSDFVFGPSYDGGYWLVGTAKRGGAEILFNNIDWSSDRVLTQTLENIPTKFRVTLLEKLLDVDDGETYKTWRQGLKMT